MRIEVVGYDDSRRAAVLALQRHLWGRDLERNGRIFDWRYVDTPLTNRPFVYLLLLDGEVAGMRGFLPSRWTLGHGSETSSALCACDLVLDPQHEGKGLVRHLMEGALRDLAAQGHQVVLSFSASPATALLSQRQGWERVVDYDFVAAESGGADRLHRAQAAIARVPQGKRIGRLFARWVEGPAMGRLDRSKPDTELAPGIVVSDRPRATAMLALMSGDEATGRLRPSPTQESLEWRFRNPQRRYRFLYCEEAGRLIGFLALSARRVGFSEVTIVDHRAVSEEIETRLFAALVQKGGVPRLVTWSAGLSSAARDTLRRLGFTAFDASRGVSRFRPGFLVRATGDVSAPASWRLLGRDVRRAESWELRPLLSDAH